METKSGDINNMDEKNEQNETVGTDNPLNSEADSEILSGKGKLEDPEKIEDQEFEGINEKTDTEDEKNKILIDSLKMENSKIADENKKLSNEIETLKDRLLRTNAEYENFRKRTAKEKEGIYTDACEDVLKNMFPVLDNLERAVSISGGNVEDLRKGIDMTIRQFKDSLERLQVEEITTDGEFDPNFHNAVMHVEDENLGRNAIVEVFQKGYKRGGKVLRHSMVKVAN